MIEKCEKVIVILTKVVSKNRPLTLCILMDSSMMFDSITLAWFIVHINGLQLRISRLRIHFSPKSLFLF